MRAAFLENLWVAAQPIIELSTGDIIGYETLIRGHPASPWATPAQLFAEARRSGLEAHLEAQCRSLGIAWGLRHLNAGQKLFLNVHGGFPTLPVAAGGETLPPARVALEISEHHNTLENAEALHQIERWRAEGYDIVIDDYGVGYAGLGLLLAVQPRIVKMDRMLVEGIDHVPVRQSVVAHFRELAIDQGITLLAEGIETEAELRTLQQMGIPLGQGFYLGRPQAEPVNSTPVGVAAPSSTARISWSAESSAHRHGLAPSDQEILEKASQAVYATPFPAYVVTRTRTIVAWNEAAAQLTGWTRDQMEHHRCRDQRLNHHDLQGNPLCVGACPLVWTMAKNEAHKQEVLGFSPAGERLPLEVLATPLWNPVTHRMVGAVEYFWSRDAVLTPGIHATNGPGSRPRSAPAASSSPGPHFRQRGVGREAPVHLKRHATCCELESWAGMLQTSHRTADPGVGATRLVQGSRSGTQPVRQSHNGVAGDAGRAYTYITWSGSRRAAGRRAWC